MRYSRPRYWDSQARIGNGSGFFMDAIKRKQQRIATVIGILLSVVMSACMAPGRPAPTQPPGSGYARVYSTGFADGQAYGRAQAAQQMRDDPAFRVTPYELSICRDEVSSLPRTGAIEQIIWWRSRQRNLWLLAQCRTRNDAKTAVIYRMIDRVRADD